MKENFCCESNGSHAWLPLQVKFETQAQILAMRLAEAAGDLANIKFFFHRLLRPQKILTEKEKGSKVIKRKDYVL